MPQRRHGSLVLTKRDQEIHDRARAAFAEAQKLLPGWRAMARMLARNPKLQVGLHAHMRSFTDGQNISIRVPPELADLPEHDRSLCGSRDERNVLECPACDVLEDVNITIIHELSHIIFDTFEEVSAYEQAQLLQNAIMIGAQGRSDDSRAAKIKRRIEELPVEDRKNYLALGNAISPFMPTLINACEDIRVNSLMQQQRPGTRIMFDAQTQKVFDNGVKQLDGNYMHWRDQPLNAQAIIGVYCKVGGFRYDHALAPEVVAALDDPELVEMCDRMRETKSIRQVYRLSIPLLEILRRLGFCLDKDDPEDEPAEEDPGEGMEDTEGEDTDEGDDEGEPSDSPGDQDGGGAESQSDDDEPQEGESGSGGDSDEAGDSDDSDGDTSSENSGDSSDESEGEGDGDGSPDDESDAGADSSESDGDEDGEADSSESQGSEGSSGGNGSDSARPEELGEGNDDSAGDLDESGQGDGDEAVDPDDAAEDGSDGPGEAPESPATAPPADDPGEDPGSPTDGPQDASESPQDDGKDTSESDSDQSSGEMGTPEDVERILVQFGRHENAEPSPSEALEEQEFEEALEMAIEQMKFFDAPSLNVSGVTEHKLEDGTGAWAHSPYSTAGMMDVSEGVLSTALQRLRIMFTDNARGRTERNRRTGKVDGRVLAKRAPAGDDRLFKKRIIPGRKDYFVLIGLDVSGSTAQIIDFNGSNHTIRLDLMKTAAGAKAELLARLGIPFAMYAHSGAISNLDIFEIKGPKEQWGAKQREALAKLRPYSANLDGHTLEYYRKVIEKRPETDRLLLYYTDGAMPAANFNEELEILQREIKNLDQMGVHLVGIGVQSDAPREHGLDTILLNDLDDIPEVVKQLRIRLMK